MCRWLNIPRSSYYYQAVDPVSEADLEDKITYIFLESKSRYGARKIKKCLEKDGIILSRRRIRRIHEAPKLGIRFIKKQPSNRILEGRMKLLFQTA